MTWDRVNTKNEQALAASDRSNAKQAAPTTPGDLVLRDLAFVGDHKGPTVYATDSILSQFMGAPRSVLPWDLVATRLGEHVMLLDRRPTTLDLLTVNESAHESHSDPVPADQSNHPNNLTIESADERVASRRMGHCSRALNHALCELIH
jgi:translation initiation factor 3 subunit D